MIFNFDYIFFIFGLIFIFLAIILWTRSDKLKKIDTAFSWKLLAIFTFLFGITK